MVRGFRAIVIAAAAAGLQGCLAKAAVDVATLPVRAVSKGVDLATTSQSEADQKRGREIRQREERLGRLERDYGRQMNDCQEGNRRACDNARKTYAEIQMLLPTIPVEAED